MAFQSKKVKLLFGAVVGAFILSGPLQHTGALPKSPVGDMSISAFKLARGTVIQDAQASCGVTGFGGFSNLNNFSGNQRQYIATEIQDLINQIKHYFH